ncbi:MAG: hypothetical protein ACKV22_36865 [Bryobacteraceae bacterium]
MWLFWLCLTLPVLLRAAEGPSQDYLPIPSGVRQLFLDDFLLGDVNGVERRVHQPRKYERNPVVNPDRPWEKQGAKTKSGRDTASIQIRSAPCWDANERVWKMWYFGEDHRVLFARSTDGVTWEKPVLNRFDSQGSKANNIIGVEGDPGAMVQHVVLDPEAPAERRYKGFIGPHGRQPVISSDGYTFRRLPVKPIPSQDESHLNYDELGKQWIATVKLRGPFGRSVYMSLSKDFEQWTEPELIFHADALDQENGAQRIQQLLRSPNYYHPFVNHPSEHNVEIYNMPVFPYEGLYIGLPNFLESSGRTPPPHNNQDGTNSVKLAVSRDLRHWTKVGKREYFIPISEHRAGILDSVQILAASRPIRMGDELWFYYSGLDGRYRPDDSYHGAIHLAKLRRDGFVSFHAGPQGGFVETRPIRFTGSRLMVNADAAQGEVRAEIVDERGRNVLAGWEVKQSQPVKGNQLAAALSWSGHAGLAALRGKTVRLRFHLRNSDLYSFWFAP